MTKVSLPLLLAALTAGCAAMDGGSSVDMMMKDGGMDSEGASMKEDAEMKEQKMMDPAM